MSTCGVNYQGAWPAESRVESKRKPAAFESVERTSALLPREMNHHWRVLAIRAPRPRFRDVIRIIKMQHQLMLVPDRFIRQVSRALKFEREFLDFTGARRGTHARLIIRRAIVHDPDGIAINGVQRHHILAAHPSRRE